MFKCENPWISCLPLFVYLMKKSRMLLQVIFLWSSIVSDKIELMMLCGVLQSNFSCLSQSESRTQPCHVRIGVLRRFQHCTGHITTGSWKGRGNQYIQLVMVLYCKLPTNGKQLLAFPLESMPGTEPRPQRWEARVLPLWPPSITHEDLQYNTRAALV